MAKKTSTTKACPTEKEQWTPSKRYMKKMEDLPGVVTGFSTPKKPSSTPERERVVTRDDILLAAKEDWGYIRGCNTIFQDCFLVVDVDTTKTPWEATVVGEKKKTKAAAESSVRRLRLLPPGHVAVPMAYDTYMALDKNKTFTRMTDLPTEARPPAPSETRKYTTAGIVSGGSFFPEQRIYGQPTIKEKSCPTIKEQSVYKSTERERKRISRLEREMKIEAAQKKALDIKERVPYQIRDWCDERDPEKYCFAVVIFEPAKKKGEYDKAFLYGRYGTVRAARIAADVARGELRQRGCNVVIKPIEEFNKLELSGFYVVDQEDLPRICKMDL